jgi:ERCC4-related helicase
MCRNIIYDNNAGLVDNEDLVVNLFKKKMQKALDEKVPISVYCAVGFFFMSGLGEIIPDLRKLYEKNLLREFYVIMGTSTTQNTMDLLNKIREDATSEIDDLSVSFLSQLFEDGIFQFKIYYKKKMHLKLYVFKYYYENECKTEIWSGSANLTKSGLTSNIELLSPINPTQDELEKHLKVFEALWKDGVDEIEGIHLITLIEEEVTGEFVELPPKILTSYIIHLRDKRYLLPDMCNNSGEELLEFQKVSKAHCLAKLHEWGGVVLSNSVGLGKTFVACSIIRDYYLNGKKVLIIHPPTIEHQWMETLNNFEVPVSSRVNLLSMGKLQKDDINPYNYVGYELIVIDEAHNFRGDKSNRRRNLLKIIEGNDSPHTLLITATPVNNSLKDYLSLVEFFVKKPKYRDKLIKNGIQEEVDLVRKNLGKNPEIAMGYIRSIMERFSVRIDWPTIMSHFKNDLIKLNATLNESEVSSISPKINVIKYSYNEKIVEQIYNKIPDCLTHLTGEYYKLVNDHYNKRVSVFNYKWVLYKRLESSLYAYKHSLERAVHRNKACIELCEEINRVKSLSPEIVHKYNDIIEDDKIKNIYNNYLQCDKSEREKIITRLKNDVNVFKSMLNNFDKATSTTLDSKLDKLTQIVEEYYNTTKQVIIFSESKDTVEYIYNHLKNKGIEKIESYYSSKKEKKKRKTIQEFFKKGDVRVLVTTDSLSEGINLPAHAVINFDLPYNPVRLIQRAGRAFRINQLKQVYIYNFNPDPVLNKTVEICDKLDAKVEDIISSVGMDFIVWNVDEELLNAMYDKSTKRAVKLIEEYKTKYAHASLEELDKLINSIVNTREFIEDQMLSKLILKYNITIKDVDKYCIQYEDKPAYCHIPHMKEHSYSYYIVYTYQDNIESCVNIKYDPKVGTHRKLAKYDITKINEAIQKQIKEWSKNTLSYNDGIEEYNAIFQLACDCPAIVRRLIIPNLNNIKTLSKKNKTQLKHILEEYVKYPSSKQKNKYVLKEVTSNIKKILSNSSFQITLDGACTPIQIKAIIKYTK